MALNASDYLSIIALTASLASVYYTKKQSEFSRISAHNDYLAYVSTQHEKYRVVLKEVGSRHKEEIYALSREASQALKLIVDLFDEYDTGEGEPLHLRHLVHECSEMVYCTFKGQLGWQSGLNISDRFYRISHIEERLNPRRHLFGQDKFVDSLRNRYLNNPNIFQEQELLDDFYFCSLIKQIKKRTDSARKADLLLRVQDALQPFRMLLNKLQPELCGSASRLEEMLEESDLDQFSLEASPKLRSRLMYQQATLEILGNLLVARIDLDAADCYYNFVSWCIYHCAILHAIQDFHSWGWDRP